MSVLFTILDDTYSANNIDGKKRIFGTFSFTNPYTANGESVTVSTYFPNKFLGGHVTAVSAAVTAALAGVARSGTFRGDSSSTTSAVLFQMFQTGLAATASAGLWVDNTTANISATTCTVEMMGY
jgi:hypothetical protein